MTKQRLYKKFWSPIVNKLTPYAPGEQPITNDYVKLNTNENPSGPSLHVKEAIINELKKTGANLRLYPKPESDDLRKAIANYYKINNNQVFVGNGSDEVLAFCFQALLCQRGVLALPEITYSFYPSLAKLFGISTNSIRLADDFSFGLDNLNSDIGSVIFANPNATTGISLTKNYIRKCLIANPDKLFIVDEAYVDFGAQSCVNLIKKHKNILVTQTFSKSRGLAGVRLGFAMGDFSLIYALRQVKNSFNTYPVDRLAYCAGIASLQDKKWFKSNKEKIIENRKLLTLKLEKLGFRVLPSHGNFVLTSHTKIQAKKIVSELKKNKILVRHFNKNKIKNWLRISIGTKRECEKLLKVLRAVVLQN